jgi:hypothetical protein
MAYSLSSMVQDALMIQDVKQGEEVQNMLKIIVENLIEMKPHWLSVSLASILSTIPFDTNSKLAIWILKWLQCYTTILEPDEHRFVLTFLWIMVAKIDKDRKMQVTNDILLREIAATASALFKSSSKMYFFTDYIGILGDIQSHFMGIADLGLGIYVNERRNRLLRLFKPSKPFFLLPGYSHTSEYMLPEYFGYRNLFTNVPELLKMFDKKSQIRRLLIWGYHFDELRFIRSKEVLQDHMVLDSFIDIVQIMQSTSQESDLSQDMNMSKLFETLDQFQSFPSEDMIFWKRWFAIFDRLFALCHGKWIDFVELIDKLHEKACISNELKRDNIFIWLILQLYVNEECGTILMKDIDGDEILFKKLSHLWSNWQADCNYMRLLRDIALPAFCSRFGQNLKDRATLPTRHPATKTMLPIFQQIRLLRESFASLINPIMKGKVATNCEIL